MPDKAFDVLIVGGGHGGAQLAIALRKENFAGSIGIVTDELELPYERPPLSKEYFAGDKAFDRLLIRPSAFWEERNIELLLGKRVQSVDPSGHFVTAANGDKIYYGQMVWATGGAPRLLSVDCSNLQGVHTMRNRSDVDAMLSEMDAVSEVVIIGGGFIGLEAAAVLRKLGKKVVLLETQDRVLARVSAEPLSRFYEGEHLQNGVDVRLGIGIAGIEDMAGRATGVRLTDGGFIPGQMVIVGIGIVPAVSPLLEAGANGSNGVDVDEYCRTSLPDIYAIGDCAAHASSFAGGTIMRVESVQNAHDMASAVAKTINTVPTAYNSVPWFWSNQYDLRLQTVGLSTGYDDYVVRGAMADRAFSVIYLKNGRVVALDCVNSTKDYVQGRAFVVGGVSVDPHLLSDVTKSLKEILLETAQ